MDTILITGAGRGIGLELCRHYRKAGAHVIAVARRDSADLQALGIETLNGIELTKSDDLDRLIAALNGRHVDLAILNAGVLHHDEVGQLADQAQAIRDQFEVNALAPLLLAERLVPNLHGGGRLALVSSRVGSIADNGSGHNYGYRMSKVALNIAGKSLSIDLKSKGIAVFLLHPGYVQTDMTGGRGDATAADAAGRLMTLLGRLGPADTGTFWHANGTPLPW